MKSHANLQYLSLCPNMILKRVRVPAHLTPFQALDTPNSLSWMLVMENGSAGGAGYGPRPVYYDQVLQPLIVGRTRKSACRLLVAYGFWDSLLKGSSQNVRRSWEAA
jgi:hypothetical protein